MRHDIRKEGYKMTDQEPNETLQDNGQFNTLPTLHLKLSKIVPESLEIENVELECSSWNMEETIQGFQYMISKLDIVKKKVVNK